MKMSFLVAEVRYGVFRRSLKVLTLVFTGLFFFLAQSGAAQDKTTVIAALGDSLTQGFGLLAEEGLTAQLQDWLTEQDHAVTVVNAGVSGDTTAGGLSRIAWTLTPDVDALIVGLGGNDVLRGTPPALAEQNLRGILDIASDKGLPILLVGTLAPNNYGADYKSGFEAIYPKLAEEYGALFHPSYLSPLVDLPSEADVFTSYFQADRLHPNAAGVALIVEAIGPIVAELAQQVQ